MRAELAEAHAAVSRVVEAMDGHLYTLRVAPDGSMRRRSTAARTARCWSAARCPPATTATACGRRSCTRRTGALGGGAGRLPAGEPVELEYRVRGLDGASAWCPTACGRAATPTARSTSTASRATSPSAGGWRTSCCAPWPRCSGAPRAGAARRAAELRASTDELTGTCNRRHFAELVAEARRTTPPAARCCCSTPTTSSTSTTPTATWSATPCWSSSRDGCSAQLDAGDLLARWGGEEFAVLLRDVPDRRGPARARRAAARRRRATRRDRPPASGCG